jgi:hypothetical protein
MTGLGLRPSILRIMNKGIEARNYRVREEVRPIKSEIGIYDFAKYDFIKYINF